MKLLPYFFAIIFLAGCSRQPDSTATPPGTDAIAATTPGGAIGNQLGSIRFEVSGNAEAQRIMQRGVKLLHHMMYAEADREFAAALAADPDCVLAYWGRAMTIIHPLWPDVPDDAQLARGWELVQQGIARGPKSPRETAYLAALELYYRDAPSRRESERLGDLDKAWGSVAAQFPHDMEAACFSALFHLAPARFLPADKSHRIQFASGTILQGVLAEIPDHPGAQHYKIHAFDFPLLAGRALEICDDYGTIAPDVPHALHMPTHIYTRVGLWEKSIELNKRAAEASFKLGKAEGLTKADYPHSLDYLVYAYLQTGQYQEAREIRDSVLAMRGPFHTQNQAAIAFAFSAIPARLALDQHHWAEAARLETRQPGSFPWGAHYEHFESIVHFARSLGAARSGQLELARAHIAGQEEVAQRITERNPGSYWDVQGRVQLLTSKAWLALHQGQTDDALRMMREAADLEDTAEKEAVTPGEAIPARELLGDMLAEMNLHRDALEAYETALAGSPNRLNSLFGAATAAEQSGDAAKAAVHFQALLKVTANANAGIDQVKQARAFLAAK